MNFFSKLKAGLKRNVKQGRKNVMKDDRRLKSSRFNGRFAFSITFWLVLAGVVFFAFQSWARTGFLNEKVNGYQDQASAQIASLNEVGFSNSPAGTDYANRFLETYLNVPSDKEEREKRAETLQSFLAEGLKVGELENLSAFEGKRVLKDVSLYDVKNVREDAASYVYRIDYELFNVIETKEEVEVKEKDEEGEGKLVTEEKVTTKDESVGVKQEMIVVRLGTDGNSFNVIEQPFYQALPSETRLAAVSDQTDQADQNVKVEDELKQFATQFFTSYTTNSVEEMSYLMENPESLQGLYDYRGVEDFVVYDGEEGQYVLKSIVLLQEANTGLQTKHPFTLVVSKENNKYYVQELKHTIGG
ncbi:conjugal transfer protein (plasmid) [Pseudalkalibacillus hwajinpoensis]|uniref:conjugal transfer protein n=1 Tax=Guptibacillus hwajinpoensis TaxID=208199 RepID=UPI00325C02DF